MGRMPNRFFPEVLRGCENVSPPFGLQLAKPPVPTPEKPELAVVIINTQNLSAEQMMDVSNVLGSFSQLFGGYEIQTSQVDQFVYMYDDPAPAIRFGMLVQVPRPAPPFPAQGSFSFAFALFYVLFPLSFCVYWTVEGGSSSGQFGQRGWKTCHSRL